MGLQRWDPLLLALNRLLSTLILVSKQSSFQMQRRLRGSHAHFLCHLHSLKAEMNPEKQSRKKWRLSFLELGRERYTRILHYRKPIILETNYHHAPHFKSDSSHRKVLVMLGFASQLNLESTTYLGSPYQRQCMCSEVWQAVRLWLSPSGVVARLRDVVF